MALRSTSLSLLITFSLSAVGCASQRGAEYLLTDGALGPYSGAVVDGGFAFVSGKVGAAAARESAFSTEVTSAIDAVERELERAGCSLDDVVFVNVYLTDLDRYGEFNDLYAAGFGPPYPARALVEVSRLPGGARVEIQAIARR